MSNFYKHENDEVRLDRYERNRPPMPTPSPSAEVEMKRYLLGRKLSYNLAHENSWYASRAIDGYDRIVIPCSNSLGIPYYQARAIDKWTFVRYNSPPASRKDSIALVWPRRTVQKRGTVIVEGPLDALAAAMLGYVGVGLMGNEPPEEVVNYIVQLVKATYEPVLIIPDLDHAEMGAFMTGSLSAHGIEVSMRLPGKKDLAGMSIEERERLVA